MPSDQDIKISLKTCAVPVDIVIAQVVQKLEDQFQPYEQCGKRDEPAYIPVSDDLINYKR